MNNLVFPNKPNLSKAEPITDSLIIAKEFGRTHKHVLESLRGLIKQGHISRPEFRPSDYLDSRGKKQPKITLNETGFLMAMPFIGGKKSKQGQRLLVDSFLALKKELGRVKDIRPETKDSNRTINALIQMKGNLTDKPAGKFTYINEAKLINACVGIKSGQRDSLTVGQLEKLEEAQRLDEKLLINGLDYKERRRALTLCFGYNLPGLKSKQASREKVESNEDYEKRIKELFEKIPRDTFIDDRLINHE